MQELRIAPQDAGRKLENFLKKQFPIGYIRKLFRKNGIRVNGRRAKPDDEVNAGDVLQIFIPYELTRRPAPGPTKDRALAVVFEDPDILVIDKPPGIAVHEASGIARRETVIGILESRYRDQNIRPQLVHRIDRDTSGILLLAKNSDIARELESEFENGAVDKVYLTLIAGRLGHNTGTIDLPLPGREDQPVRALTRFNVKERFSETTLVEAHIDTGRLHQIRLHFAKLGHPVVMDERHGDYGFNKTFRKRYSLKRQFLHAAKLAVHYRGKKGRWNAPIPTDLARVLQTLRTENKK